MGYTTVSNDTVHPQVENLRNSIEVKKAESLQKREADERAHLEEVDRIQKNNEHLKQQLETMLSAPKK